MYILVRSRIWSYGVVHRTVELLYLDSSTGSSRGKMG